MTPVSVSKLITYVIKSVEYIDILYSYNIFTLRLFFSFQTARSQEAQLSRRYRATLYVIRNQDYGLLKVIGNSRLIDDE